ncbi:TetR/AcrR family transcriptional regulator (plasmid) [Rhizobium leguminosarum]
MGKKIESDAVVARRAEVAKARRERSRQALMSAAFDLLGREFGRIDNVDAIVVQAGVTRGTFYNNYGSLDELLKYLSKHITHGFNLKVLEYIGSISSPPEQATIFTKAYMQKASADHRWGWGMVNLSLYGPILGSASSRMTESNVRRGIESGDYTCASVSVGCDIASGALLAGMMRILREGNSKGYISGVAQGVMLALGVQEERAKLLARKRLPSTLGLAFS